jgi:hypothetical protein
MEIVQSDISDVSDMIYMHSILDHVISYITLMESIYMYIHTKVKQSRYRPGVAQRVPGS